VSQAIVNVLVDSDMWDGSLVTGMLAVVPSPVSRRPRQVAFSFTPDEAQALRHAYDDLDA
jgi:hypothetical protein